MIEIKNLYKYYDNKLIFKNFSLSLELNKIYTLKGPSGIGKTTLLKIIAGIENFEKGFVKIPKNLKIGFVFQEDRLVPWLNIKENINLISNYNQNQLFDFFELEKVKFSYPHTLSGGMKKRVNFLRAISYNPNFLILDEPFSGLDLRLKNKFLNYLKYLNKENNIGLIISTHDDYDSNFLNSIDIIL